MIYTLKIKDSTKIPIDHWEKVSSLKQISVDFSPNLNIVIGSNGCGKSTLLLLLRRAFHCESGYYSCITQHSIDSFDIKNKDGFEITHDGMPVFSYDSSKSVGIIAGGFDNDFFSEGLSSLFMKKMSSGQKTVMEIQKTFNSVKEINKIEDKFGYQVNDIWLDKRKRIDEFLTTSDKPNERKTIILDEPTKSLDFMSEMVLWDIIEKQAQKTQIIIATHSIGVLRRFSCDTKIIELEDGYLNKMKSELNKFN